MPRQPAPIDPFCCDISRDSGESLFGSAPSVKTWFLLEYRGTWHRKATEQNELPQKVKTWLEQALAATPSSRLLFIRKPRSASKPGRAFFVAQTDEASPRLYHFHLDRYASLLSIDLAPLLAGDKVAEVFRHKEPLYLVCTNGRGIVAAPGKARPSMEPWQAYPATGPGSARTWAATALLPILSLFQAALSTVA